MGHSYSCEDNTAVGDITLYVEEYDCSRGHNSLCGGISYNLMYKDNTRVRGITLYVEV
jgi:hypothetical protein